MRAAAFIYCLATATGCAGFGYVAPKEQMPKLAADELQIDIKELTNPWGMGVGVDVVVHNVSDHLVVFNPDEITLRLPAGGRRYKHTNKFIINPATGVPGAFDLPNVAYATAIPAGQTYAAVVWFEVKYDDLTSVKSADVEYRNQTITLPPAGHSSSSPPRQEL